MLFSLTRPHDFATTRGQQNLEGYLEQTLKEQKKSKEGATQSRREETASHLQHDIDAVKINTAVKS